MPESTPLDGPTVSIRLARALAAGEADAATIAREISAAPPPKDPNLPRTVGRYRILDLIGRGGMGIVYGAWDDRLRRPVALKMLRAALADADDTARFQREVRIAASLRHPGIVPVHDVGEEGGDPFFTMDVVDGVPLDVHCSRNQLDLRARAGLVARAAEAVHHAHEAGILHRDLKPGNILVTPAGQPVILDFGLAKDLGAQGSLQTVSGTAMGTPAYMPPEQASGRSREMTRRSDVYSLGVVLYQIATGRLPFEGTDPLDICRKVVDADTPSPRTVSHAVPRDLETVILHAMEKIPARRYPTALALARDLDRFVAGDPVEASRPSLARRVARKIRKHRTLSLAASLLLTSAASVCIFIWHARRSQEAMRESAAERSRATASVDRGRVLLLKANRHFNDGEHEEAVSAADEAIRLAPLDPLPHMIRANALENLGRALDAIAACDRAFALNRHFVDARTLKARLLMRIGRNEEALAEAEAVLTTAPLDTKALRIRAALLGALGRNEEALAAADRAIEAHGPDADTHSNRALALIRLDRPADALAACDRALQLDPGLMAAHRNRASALMLLGRIEECVAACDAALRVHDDDPEVHCDRAFALLSAGRPTDALAAADRAAALRPTMPQPHAYRSMALVALSRLDEALQASDLALSLPGGDLPLAHLQRGISLILLSRAPEALPSLDRALAINPSMPMTHYYRSVCHAALGDPARARIDYDWLRDNTPDSPLTERLRLHLGLPTSPPR